MILNKTVELQIAEGMYMPTNVELDCDWFDECPYIYNHKLAYTSLCFSCAAFSAFETMKNWGCCENCGRDADIIKIYNDFNFKDIYSDGYDRSLNYSGSKAAYTFASKECNGHILISVVIRGGGYGCEWTDNFNVNSNYNENIHNGFKTSASEIKKDLIKYMSQYSDNEIKIWICGFSRGGAVANILSALLIDTKPTNSCEIFSYTFASPRVTSNNLSYAKGVKYGYIFNIVNEFDPVTVIPPKIWGFIRYGTDCILPYDSESLGRVSECLIGLSGKKISFSKTDSIASVLHIMTAFASSVNEYKKYYQNAIMDFVKIYTEKCMDKRGKWNSCDRIKALKELYGKKAEDALNKSKLYDYKDIVKKIGYDIPEEIIIINALCRIHGCSNPERIFKNLIFGGKIKEIFSLLKNGISFEIFDQHSVDLYMCWMRRTIINVFIKN